MDFEGRASYLARSIVAGLIDEKLNKLVRVGGDQANWMDLAKDRMKWRSIVINARNRIVL